jgi:hypothetical protein
MAGREVNRRGFIKGTMATSAGVALGLHSFEEQNLLAQAAGGAKVKDDQAKPASGKMAYGQIKNLKSEPGLLAATHRRRFHSRDLRYVSSLVKAYHTDEKIFETFELAEEMGINTVLTNPVSDRVINKYWNERGGKIQWISDCASGKDIQEGIKRSVDSGAHGVYVQGGIADGAARDGKIAAIGEALDYPQFKVPAASAPMTWRRSRRASRRVSSRISVKTLHPDNY